MCALKKESTIVVSTANGDREIQLLFGDITQLPVEEKVDVIMVSAFPVIGALNRNLGLSVRKLAEDKEEDMRRTMHVWWSKPLPSHLPYKKLVCFERMRGNFYAQHPASLIGDVFRCFVPVFGGVESSVITPILAAGDQGYSRKKMLQAMVDAAVNWMQSGLPLVCLKIVIYTRSASNLSQEETNLVATFNGMKKNVEKKKAPEEAKIEYDVYLSYAEEDEDSVKDAENMLKEEKKDVRIFSKHQKLDLESVWQKDIHDVMVTCVKVIAFLSPAYLSSVDCLEQYNIAVCCDRTRTTPMLAPFYIVHIPKFPTYMCLVQYLDVRITEGEKSKLNAGCKQLVTLLEETSADDGLVSKHQTTTGAFPDYDVFISYSHQNPQQANFFLQTLKLLNPELKVFFDRDELKAGTSWQQVLYHSVDGARCAIALLSPDYLTSAVCQEEYNLSLMKHLSRAHSLELIPFCIEPMPGIPTLFSFVSGISGLGEDFEVAATSVCQQVAAYLRTGEKTGNVFHRAESSYDIAEISEEWRKLYFKKNFMVDGYKVVSLQGARNTTSHSTTKQDGESNPNGVDVAISCTGKTKALGQFLAALLRKRSPNLTTNLDGKMTKDAQLSDIDSAKIVICLVTPDYITSRTQVEEYQLALFRQRANRDRKILYPIHVHPLPQKPSYFHLVECYFACYDSMWSELVSSAAAEWKSPFDDDVEEVKSDRLSKGLMISDQNLLTISVACDDILEHLNGLRHSKQNIIYNIGQMKMECDDLEYHIHDQVDMDEFLKQITHLRLEDMSPEDRNKLKARGNWRKVEAGVKLAQSSKACQIL